MDNNDNMVDERYTRENEVNKSHRGTQGFPTFMLLFTVVLVGIGVYVIGAYYGYFPDDVMKKVKFKVPGLFFVYIGALLVLLGLYIAHLVFKESKRKGYRASMRHRAPWTYDYAWRQDGISDETGKSIKGYIKGLFIMTLFLAPLHYAIFFNPLTPFKFNWIVVVVFGFFDIIILIMFFYMLYLIARQRKFGSTKLNFGSFPFSPDNPVKLAFEGGYALAGKVDLKATLRCIREKYVVRREGSKSKGRIRCFRLYEDNTTFSTDSTGRAALEFEIPDDSPSTKLIERFPTYWELIIKADLPGVDYEGVFLVPIYNRA